MKINLDGTNGHIIIALSLISAGIGLSIYAPAPGIIAMGGTLFGVGLERLKRSLDKTNDENGK